jgi:hypothetical protein
MSVPFEKVPIDVRRRAARALAALTVEHVSPPSRRKSEPRFGMATPVYRPDLKDVAYWEIEVEGVVTTLPDPKGDGAVEYDRGFILVATGGHDVPVPHFSLELAPPSHRLARFGDVARVVKLDSLCYAAEDEKGGLIGQIGTMPPKLNGMPAELPARLPQGRAVTAGGKGEDGEKTEPVRIRATKEKRPVKPGPWRSWRELTKGYAASYVHHLLALAERAAPRWETERLTEEFGEGIRSGETRTVLLLNEGDFTISGPAADLVKAELNPQPLPPRLLLTPRADVSVPDTSFEVRLHYAGEDEVLRYFIVPEDAPTLSAPGAGPLGRIVS